MTTTTTTTTGTGTTDERNSGIDWDLVFSEDEGGDLGTSRSSGDPTGVLYDAPLPRDTQVRLRSASPENAHLLRLLEYREPRKSVPDLFPELKLEDSNRSADCGSYIALEDSQSLYASPTGFESALSGDRLPIEGEATGDSQHPEVGTKDPMRTHRMLDRAKLETALKKEKFQKFTSTASARVALQQGVKVKWKEIDLNRDMTEMPQLEDIAEETQSDVVAKERMASVRNVKRKKRKEKKEVEKPPRRRLVGATGYDEERQKASEAYKRLNGYQFKVLAAGAQLQRGDDSQTSKVKELGPAVIQEYIISQAGTVQEGKAYAARIKKAKTSNERYAICEEVKEKFGSCRKEQPANLTKRTTLMANRERFQKIAKGAGRAKSSSIDTSWIKQKNKSVRGEATQDTALLALKNQNRVRNIAAKAKALAKKPEDVRAIKEL